jgi:hypothetical protein
MGRNNDRFIPIRFSGLGPSKHSPLQGATAVARRDEMLKDRGMTHQVKSWFGADVPGAVSHPTGQSLTTKWLQIKAERDPTLADFWHETDDAFLERSILFLKSERDYIYLHHGAFLRGRSASRCRGDRSASCAPASAPG